MIVTCPKCGKSYRYDEGRFGRSPSKKLKCANCGSIFRVDNPNENLDATNIKARKKSVGKGADQREDTEERLAVESDAPELPELAPLDRDLRFSLAVIAGPQAGAVFSVQTPRVFLGRGENAEIQLKDAEVSRRHAMLEIRGEEATIVDLDSTNGTFVAGERVQRTSLCHQKEFTVGATTLMFLVTPAEEAGF